MGFGRAVLPGSRCMQRAISASRGGRLVRAGTSVAETCIAEPGISPGGMLWIIGGIAGANQRIRSAGRRDGRPMGGCDSVATQTCPESVRSVIGLIESVNDIGG